MADECTNAAAAALVDVELAALDLGLQDVADQAAALTRLLDGICRFEANRGLTQIA
jgi:hypothetical protein